MPRIIYYTYDADVHCPECAAAAGMDRDGAVDSEGNPPGVAFSTDETPCEGVLCGTCGDMLALPRYGQCASCAKPYRSHDARREAERAAPWAGGDTVCADCRAAMSAESE